MNIVVVEKNCKPWSYFDMNLLEKKYKNKIS